MSDEDKKVQDPEKVNAKKEFRIHLIWTIIGCIMSFIIGYGTCLAVLHK